ncbi:ATP phosphoribosyltransferase regulatory subunit, partial [Klebsiella pneumoniae]|uniref:ATP phosphoribosyltransferase regulatory subunit n=1 Tax=Klebsiella pneumoniae TaxID=573 RepID=UPI0022480F95
APNRAAPLAQGGRYDGSGEHFGRARPATGFSGDLYALSAGQFNELSIVVAPKGTDTDLLKMIERLRTEGLSVVQLLGQDDLSSVPNATHQLVQVAGHWNLEKI